MPNYTVPGVYVREMPSGSKPIQGVATARPAFIGFTARRPEGNTGQPVFVPSWTDFERDFGGFEPDFYTPYAVWGYFQNGGQSCYILSLATKQEIAVSTNGAGAPTAQLKTSGGVPALELKSTDPSRKVTVEVGPATGEGATDENFKVTVRVEGQEQPLEFDNLTMAPRGRGVRNAADVLTREARVLTATEIPGAGTAVERRPANASEELKPPPVTALAPAELTNSASFVGSANERTGVNGLEAVSDITMIVCPDLMTGFMERGKPPTDPARRQAMLDHAGKVQGAMLDHCTTMWDRFAILDAPPGLSPQEIKGYRDTKLSSSSSKYGALYYPWIWVGNPDSKAARQTPDLMLPPSGHLAGVYARVDQTRGVHKAPANEDIRGVTRFERNLINSEQDLLNPAGINCLRAFPGRGNLVWGARTLARADELEWMYVNVRRLFIYIEKSIYEGTQWAVFEPNDMDLWERVKRSVSVFLTRVWRDGALFGATPDEAFYVRCDAALNPAANRDLGILTVEVGLAPVKPAEFVVFQFKQMSDSGGVSE
jgi:hypothetical protein